MTKKTLYHCATCHVWNGTTEICQRCGSGCDKKEVPNKRAGLYFIGEVPQALPSVTNIIRILAKPQLDYWKCQKVAEAVFADPTISLAEAINAPNKVRDAAASKGHDIHKVVEAASRGMTIDINNYQEPWRSHVQAYLDFQREVPHKILAAEQVVYSKTHLFAGTLDAVADIGGTKYLLDYKTNKSIYPLDHSLQLGGYMLALQDMGQPVDKCGVVHLKSDGTYAFHEIKPQPEMFLSCLKLFKFLNQ